MSFRLPRIYTYITPSQILNRGMCQLEKPRANEITEPLAFTVWKLELRGKAIVSHAVTFHVACILIKRAPSWIQTRKRLGERRKCVLGSGRRIYDRKLQNENACTSAHVLAVVFVLLFIQGLFSVLERFMPTKGFGFESVTTVEYKKC